MIRVNEGDDDNAVVPIRGNKYLHPLSGGLLA
jgi:hypothetical protein